MTRKFTIEGIGSVKLSEVPEEFALKIQLSDMQISRDIKFFSKDLLNGFFQDITEVHAKEMAVATIKNKIDISIKDIDQHRK